MKKDLKNIFKAWLAYALISMPIAGVFAALDYSPSGLTWVLRLYAIFVFALPLAIAIAIGMVLLFIWFWVYSELFNGD